LSFVLLAYAAYAKMCPIPTDDPYGVKRLENSQAKTPAGIKRLFNQVAREWGLGALTDAEDCEQSKETLEPGEPRHASVARATCLAGASPAGLPADLFFRLRS
jgi:hypothetical protein